MKAVPGSEPRLARANAIRVMNSFHLQDVYKRQLLLWLTGCYPKRTTSQIESRKYQAHKKFEDTSFVYELPFKVNTRHRIIQGYFSRYTHKYKAAVDFKMKNGTPVLAVRDGKVLRIKEDSDIGGWKKKYRGDANYIIIEHTDSCLLYTSRCV